MKKNEFIVLRHSYDDHSYIDGKNDTSLTQRGIEIAQKAAVNMLQQVNSDKVIIRHSTKIRAQETAEIVCEHLLKHSIDCHCVKDFGLTELFQGKFNFGNMEHIERVNFLQSCWDDFEHYRQQGDLTHHFGQNKNTEIILTYGENHSEWSQRIANGVLNIISDMENSYQSINVTHRGAIHEIERIIEMVNGIITPDQVELYNTRWMEYCQDYSLCIDNLDTAKVLIKKFINERGK